MLQLLTKIWLPQQIAVSFDVLHYYA